MAETDVRLKQEAVNEFLVAEGEEQNCNRCCFNKAYGEITVDMTAGCFTMGKTD
jgi:hypothetical protein